MVPWCKRPQKADNYLFAGLFVIAIISEVTSLTSFIKFTLKNGILVKPGDFGTENADSAVECCAICSRMSNCFSINYKTESKSCNFVLLSNFPVLTTDVSETSRLYSIDDSDWSLVFVGIAGIGTDIYDAWVNGNGVTSEEGNCKSINVTSCSSHYRSTAVDSWENLRITQVRFSVYKDGEEKQYVTFNGSGTSYMNWFQKDRILESSWQNLTTESYNYFSIDGLEPARRFHINLNHGGCAADRGYTIVLTSDTFPCGYDKYPSYPAILYAEGPGPVVFESGNDLGLADFITIAIKTTSN